MSEPTTTAPAANGNGAKRKFLLSIIALGLTVIIVVYGA